MTKWLLLSLSFLCCFLPFSFAIAGMQVNNIKVNVKSDSGLKARELAIADARRQAFVELTQNNSAFSYDLKTKGMPTDKALEAAVDTFEIDNEKISAKQYIGTLSITFSDQGLRRLLRGHYEEQETDERPGANKEDTSPTSKETQTSNKDVVLLPIYITSDESLLWKAGNPWHTFWQTAPQEDVFRTLVPLGDVQDIMGTSIEDIMTGHYQRVQLLLDRYDKEALVVAVLKRISREHNELELTVKLFHKERLVFSSEPLFIDAETLDNSFVKARVELIKVLQDQGASVLETKDAGLQTYVVTAIFNSFAQWQQIRRGLKTGAIQRFKVSSLSRTHAKIVMKSNLSFNILASELARKGLVLGEGAPGNFTVHVGFTQKPLPATPSPLNTPEQNEPLKIRSAFDGRS